MIHKLLIHLKKVNKKIYNATRIKQIILSALFYPKKQKNNKLNVYLDKRRNVYGRDICICIRIKRNAIKQLYDSEVSGIDYFHIDVMDGEFVKNNTVDRMVEYCEYLNSISLLPLDVHLMVKDIKKFVNKFIVFEPNNITFHLEACKDENEVKELIKYIKNNNCKVGISISPKTNIEEIYRYLPYIHNCLVMTVEPGEGGQALIPETIDKINKLYK